MASPAVAPSVELPLDWKKMKVHELREVLASRGLDTSGLKASLIERLENSLKDSDTGGDEKPRENLKQVAAGVQDGAPDHEATVMTGVPAKSQPLPDNAGPPEIAKEASTVSVAVSGKHEANGTNHGAASNVGSLTDLEKKQRRAERFGMDLQVSEEEKRRLRAARFGGGVQGAGDKTEAEKRNARAARFGIVDEQTKRKARLERFGPDSKQGTSVENERRQARAARFGIATEESSEAKKKLKTESAGTLTSA